MAKVERQPPVICHCGRPTGRWSGIWPRSKRHKKVHCDRCQILGCDSQISKTGHPPKSCTEKVKG